MSRVKRNISVKRAIVIFSGHGVLASRRHGCEPPLPRAVALRMVLRRGYYPFGINVSIFFFNVITLNPAQGFTFFGEEGGGEHEIGAGGKGRKVIFGEPEDGF